MFHFEDAIVSIDRCRTTFLSVSESAGCEQGGEVGHVHLRSREINVVNEGTVVI